MGFGWDAKAASNIYSVFLILPNANASTDVILFIVVHGIKLIRKGLLSFLESGPLLELELVLNLFEITLPEFRPRQ